MRIVSILTLLSFLPVAAGAGTLLPLEDLFPAEEHPSGNLVRLSAEQLRMLASSKGAAEPGQAFQDGWGTVSLEQLAKVERQYQPSLLPAAKAEPAPAPARKEALPAIDLDGLLALAETAQAPADERIQLAKPFVVKKGDATQQGGAFVIRKAPAASSQKAAVPEDQLLAEADQQLEAGEVADAFAAYVNILEQYPASAAAELAEQSLEELAQYAEDGQWTPEDVQALTPQLPYVEELSNLKSKYWMARGFYIAGIAGVSEKSISKSDYFAESRDVARSLMLEYPDAPEQLDVVDLYFESATGIGYEGIVAASNDAKDLIAQQPPSVAMWLTRLHLGHALHYQQNDPGHSYIEYEGAVHAFENTELPRLLGTSALNGEDKARLKLQRAVAYYATGRIDEAVAVYDEILQLHPTSGAPAHEAAYSRAFLKWYYNGSDPQIGIDVFERALALYPQSTYVPMILWSLASIYAGVKQYGDALPIYQEILERFPGTPQAIHTEKSLRRLVEAGEIAAGAVPAGVLTAKTEEESSRALCGPVALQALLRELGKDASIEELAAWGKTVSPRGTSLQGLLQAGQTAGVRLAAMKSASLEDATAPFIAHVDGAHYVLVTRVGDDDVQLIDDHKGAIWPREEFERRWSGYCVLPSSAASPRLNSLSLNSDTQAVCLSVENLVPGKG